MLAVDIGKEGGKYGIVCVWAWGGERLLAVEGKEINPPGSEEESVNRYEASEHTQYPQEVCIVRNMKFLT